MTCRVVTYHATSYSCPGVAGRDGDAANTEQREVSLKLLLVPRGIDQLVGLPPLRRGRVASWSQWHRGVHDFLAFGIWRIHDGLTMPAVASRRQEILVP